MPQNSYPLYLCGLNKTLIHWELSLQKVELFRYKDNKRLESRYKGLQRENFVDFVSSFAAHSIFLQRKTLCIFVSLCLKLYHLNNYYFSIFMLNNANYSVNLWIFGFFAVILWH